MVIDVAGVLAELACTQLKGGPVKLVAPGANGKPQVTDLHDLLGGTVLDKARAI